MGDRGRPSAEDAAVERRRVDARYADARERVEVREWTLERSSAPWVNRRGGLTSDDCAMRRR